MRRRSWIGFGFLGLFLGLVTWGFLFAWRPLPEYRVTAGLEIPLPPMSAREYERLVEHHPRPYVVEVSGPEGGGVVLYGAEHTRDPADPQIADIRARWQAWRPTVALCESRLGILFPRWMDPVRTFSEPGAVHALARRDGIPTYTWEPPRDVEIQELLAQPFSREQVALLVVLRPYFSNRRYGRPDDPEGVVAEAVRKRGGWPGLEGVFRDVDDVEAAWQRHFPEGPDWRDVSDQFGLPGFLAEIDGNRARDAHFLRVVVDLVRRGERVFAVAGSSHAVKLEPALRAALETPP